MFGAHHNSPEWKLAKAILEQPTENAMEAIIMVKSANILHEELNEN